MDLRNWGVAAAIAVLLATGCGSAGSQGRRPGAQTSERGGRVILVRDVAPEGPGTAVVEVTVALDDGGVVTVSQKAGTGRRFAVGDEVHVVSRPDGRTWLEQ